MTTQINQLTELTSTSDGDLLLIREASTGVDKKMQAVNLRAKATTKDDVGLGNVPNLDTTNAVAGNFASVNIDGGNIDGTAIGASSASSGAFTNLAYTGTLTGGTGVVNLGSGQVVKDASGNVGIGTNVPAGVFHVTDAGGDKATIFRDGKIDFVNAANSAFSGAHFGATSYFFEAGNVGIGISSPSTKLDIVTPINNGLKISDGTQAGIMFPSGLGGVVSGTVTNHPYILISNNTERVRIETNNNVNLIGGGNLILSNGAGIDFSAHPNAAGMTSELLDDYEEGAWTPLISANGGGSDTFTSSTATGRYTKIGRLVTIQCIYTYTAIQTDTGFYAWMTGLPFNPSEDSGVFCVSILNPSGADTDSYSAQAASDGIIRFFKNQNVASPGSMVGNDFPAATRSLQFQASYIV